jgi:hypothetical protein
MNVTTLINRCHDCEGRDDAEAVDEIAGMADALSLGTFFLMRIDI